MIRTELKYYAFLGVEKLSKHFGYFFFFETIYRHFKLFFFLENDRISKYEKRNFAQNRFCLATIHRCVQIYIEHPYN